MGYPNRQRRTVSLGRAAGAREGRGDVHGDAEA